MSNFKFFLILLFTVFLFSCDQHKTFRNSVNNGIADLNNYPLINGNSVTLDGDWYFWPDKLLNFQEVEESLNNGYTVYTPFPGMWQRLGVIEDSDDLINYGTMAIKLKVPPSYEDLNIILHNGASSIKMLFNNEVISEIGKVSTNINEFIPSCDMDIADINVKKQDNLLIIQVANFSAPYTGTWSSPEIGLESTILDKNMWNIIVTSLISGALIFMGLYHFALYLLRRKDISTVLFAIICICMAVRNLITGDRILIDLFPQTWLGWRVAFNVEHLSAHMTLPLFYFYFRKIFPKMVAKVPTIIVTAGASIWFLLQIATPVMFHQRFLSLYEYFLLASALYLLYVVIKSTILKVEGAYITLIGLICLIFAVVNDVLLSNGFIQGIYMSPIGVFLYTFSQSFLLSQRFSTLFNDVARYSNELQELNSSLERFIPHEILKHLDKKSIVDVKLGDYSEQEMSVFFLDIRDFTSLSETMSPNDNFRFINSFLKRFGPLIRRCGGFVDKYIGDGILALFPGDPDDAVKAALYIRTTLIHFNNERMGYNLKPINLGIGINTGNLMLGTIGENRRMDSTVISDAVNTASRLENLTKELKIDILVSGNTIRKLKNPEKFKIHNIGEREIKGRKGLIDIYSVSWVNQPSLV